MLYMCFLFLYILKGGLFIDDKTSVYSLWYSADIQVSFKAGGPFLF